MLNKKGATVLKWVGGATAILTLVFALHQLTNLVSEFFARKHHVTELLSVGRMQQSGHNFSAAWASFEEAARLNKDDREVLRAQEDLVMEWIEEAHLVSPESFTEFANRLSPVLYRGAQTASGSRKADLLAHLGWADFLASREGRGGLHPEEFYRQALAIDPHNVYAHAMWGHWVLWNRGKLEDARQHFNAALSAGRARDYVRHLQIAAFNNGDSEEYKQEIIRAANDMRKNNEPVDPGDRRRIFNIYYSAFFFDTDATMKLSATVPPPEHLATFRWMFDDMELDKSNQLLRDYYLAILQEAAGQRLEALKTFQLVRSKIPPSSTLANGVEAAIKRLSKIPESER